MYNRYIPQADGSFSRRQIPDPVPPSPIRKQETVHPEPVCESPQTPAATKQEPRRYPPTSCPRGGRPRPPATRSDDSSILSFLRQLLPKEFDSGDLLVILLLLLMSGDCAEEQNTALLTLALYLFL
ncbi:MAG: hypothetical protein IKU68_07415 [Oscillospiraceae bacterium]|nr:hypothetical protein [Oscillospiraceae bacterium]